MTVHVVGRGQAGVTSKLSAISVVIRQKCHHLTYRDSVSRGLSKNFGQKLPYELKGLFHEIFDPFWNKKKLYLGKQAKTILPDFFSR